MDYLIVNLIKYSRVYVHVGSVGQQKSCGFVCECVQGGGKGSCCVVRQVRTTYDVLTL